MEIRRIPGFTSSNLPLRTWLLAGTASLAMAVLVVGITARSVKADAHLMPVAPPIGSPVANATPASLAPAPQAPPAEKHEKHGKGLHGIASWYGRVFHGNKTASGERFDMYALTACHPTLPFGTIVRVVNRENHKSVVVRINDRGYLEEGRIIDLSYAAAKRIESVDMGLASVDIHVISLGHPRHQ